MNAVEVIAGIVGGAYASLPVWREIRESKRVVRMRDAEPRWAMRRQISRQYRAEAAVRLELSLDPWLGRGGSLLFDPEWAGINGKVLR